MRYYLICLLLIVLSACASQGYSKYYTDLTAGVSKEALHLEPSQVTPVIRLTSNPQADIKYLQENGYRMLGYSNFRFEAHNPNLALGHAKTVGASIVLYYSKDAGTRTGSIPLTTPTVSTVTSSTTGTTNGSVYGTVGTTPVYGNYSGTSNSTATSTIYGSKTTYIPYSIQYNDVYAAFFAKAQDPIFGVYVNEMDSKVARDIGRNGGVQINLIVRNSPAFQSDFFVDDIILEMNNKRVNGVKNFTDLLSSLKGQKVNVKIIRGDKEIVKKIMLGN